MRILVVTGRFPEPRSNGDQSRFFTHVQALGARHRVTVVTGSEASTPDARDQLAGWADVVVVPVGVRGRAAAAIASAARGRPGQVGWMMPPPVWAAALRRAPAHDVALVNTARSFAGRLPIPTVIDHIDAMSFNMASRARGEEAPHVRAAAALEAVLLRRWERRIATWSHAQLATSRDAAGRLPQSPRPEVFPVAWDGARAPADGPPRDIDIILTGSMTYAPNRVAASRLAHRILPAIRRQRPETTACVVGRAATELGDLPGVSIASDVADVMDYLARAKVALIPLGPGAGSPYKTLEAAAAGAAIVATRWAVDCYGMDVPVAEADDEFAAAALQLLDDPRARADVVARARATLDDLTVDAIGRRLEAVLDAARASR